MSETCETCRYFAEAYIVMERSWDDAVFCRFPRVIEGECRRYPPQNYNYASGEYNENENSGTRFPDMRDHEWCGEWKARKISKGVKRIRRSVDELEREPR